MTNYLRGMIQSDGKKIAIADCQTDGSTFFLTFPYLTRITNVLIGPTGNASGIKYVCELSPLSNQRLATSGATVIKYKAFKATGVAETSALDISGEFLTVWAFGN